VSTRVLALIRHGEYRQPPGVPSAHLPYGLTEQGRGQASAAAAPLLEFAREKGLALDPAIDCSRLRRAWETADRLGAELSLLTGLRFTTLELDALAERSLGAAANLTTEAIELILRDDPRFTCPPAGWKRDPEYRLPLPGAESLAEAGARVARHLESRGRDAQRAGTLKLIVGHGGAFRHAAQVLGVLQREQVAELSMRHCSPIYIEYRARSGEPDHVVHLAGEWPRRSRTAAMD
jgi:broad specificity phosphatase PhoE